MSGQPRGFSSYEKTTLPVGRKHRQPGIGHGHINTFGGRGINKNINR